MKRFDVIVVGSGAAGMMAAWKVSKAGLTCVILEKGEHITVSNAARCGGPALANTRLQQEQDATVTVEQLFDHMYGFSRGTVHAGLLRNALKKGREVEQALLEAGIEMTLVEDTYGAGFRARHLFHTTSVKRWEMLAKLLKAQGVKIFLQREVKHLIQKESGRVGGVVVKNLAENRVEEFYASAVVVATGGYLGNEEMLKEHFGDVHIGILGSRLSDGAGIRMVLETGGILDRNWGLCTNEFGGYHSKMVKRMSTNMYFAIGGGILVDRNGRRFMNEQYLSDEPLSLGGEMTLREGRYYALLDNEYYHALEKGSLYDYYGRPKDWYVGKNIHDQKFRWKEEDLSRDILDGIAAKADTLSELSKRFHLPYLESTVKEYNEMCVQGKDVAFGKSGYLLKPVMKAPYYIFEYEPSAWCTFGGVKTDEFCRVLSSSFQTIEGLYVAGVDNGSCYSVPYYDNEGAAAGIAFTTGIVAGEHVVENMRQGGDIQCIE